MKQEIWLGGNGSVFIKWYDKIIIKIVNSFLFSYNFHFICFHLFIIILYFLFRFFSQHFLNRTQLFKRKKKKHSSNRTLFVLIKCGNQKKRHYNQINLLTNYKLDELVFFETKLKIKKLKFIITVKGFSIFFLAFFHSFFLKFILWYFL